MSGNNVLAATVLGVMIGAPSAHAVFSTGTSSGSASDDYSLNYEMRFGGENDGLSYGYSRYLAAPQRFNDKRWTDQSAGWGLEQIADNDGKTFVLRPLANDDADLEMQFDFVSSKGFEPSDYKHGSTAVRTGGGYEQQYNDWFDKAWTIPKTALKYVGANGVLTYGGYGETHVSPQKLAQFDWRQFCREHSELCGNGGDSDPFPWIPVAVVIVSVALVLVGLNLKRRR